MNCQEWKLTLLKRATYHSGVYKSCVALLAAFLLSASVATARDKAVYRSAELIELQGSRDSFCFVVQLDDLAYVADAKDAPASNLVVGDPVEVKVVKDVIRIKTDKKWPEVEPDGSIKARIVSRQRMTKGAKLPTCALPVAVR